MKILLKFCLLMVSDEGAGMNQGSGFQRPEAASRSSPRSHGGSAPYCRFTIRSSSLPLRNRTEPEGCSEGGVKVARWKGCSEWDTVRRSVPILVSRSCLISRYERCLLTSFTHYTRPSPFISPFGLLSLRSCRTDRGDDEGVGRVVNRRCEYKKRTVNVIRPSESSVHITRGSLASLVCRSSLTPTRFTRMDGRE